MVHAKYPDLAERRVLVTGASSGIGKQVASAFLEQGARVAVHFRTQRLAAEEVCSLAPSRALAVSGDLGFEAGVRRVTSEAVARFGGLDGIVHCAGIWEEGILDRVDENELLRMFRTNTFSSFYLARDGARAGISWMTIFGSTAGMRGEPKHSVYAASKAALRGMVHSLAQELGPRIRFNLISPGWVRTPMVDLQLALGDREQRLARAIPGGRIGTVDDCAAAALFLASEGAGHLTGIELELSGGALLPLVSR